MYSFIRLLFQLSFLLLLHHLDYWAKEFAPLFLSFAPFRLLQVDFIASYPLSPFTRSLNSNLTYYYCNGNDDNDYLNDIHLQSETEGKSVIPKKTQAAMRTERKFNIHSSNSHLHIRKQHKGC